MRTVKLGLILGAALSILAVSCKKEEPAPVIEVTSVSLNNSIIGLYIGETYTLEASVRPENANDKTALWSSSKPEVASVDDSGKVTGLAEGTAVITAKAGKKSATCSVSVKRKAIPVESVSLNKTETTIEVGNTETLTATVNPADADDPTVTWSTSDAAIATVKDGVVTAIAEGTAVITAKAGNKSASCIVTVPHVWVPVESITLNKKETTIAVGNSETLTATVLPANADDPSVTWSSSDESVATVKDGVVTAIAEGTAVITATAEGDKSASCTVTVPHVYVPVESVTLDKTETTIEVGNSEQLTATVNPADADNPEVSWTSSDEAVATVKDGLVTAVAEGTAVITATADGKSASCTVTVPHVYVPVESVTLNKTALTIEVGGSETLHATVNPANADNPQITWTSSDESIAKVSSEGVVTAIAEGSATITATAEDKSATCAVTVPHVSVPVESVTLDKTEITLEVGKTQKLNATVAPSDADDPSVSWFSSDESVATVSADGLVKAIAEGTATITARSGSKSATCTVTVPHVYVPVESVTLNKNETTIEVGSSETLVATINPANADVQEVTWTSSNEKVATVSADGVVTAIAEGSATITAKAEGKSAKCKVTVPHVYVPVESITLDKTETTIVVGSTEKLTATVNPDNADYPQVTWTSSDESVATVSSEGVVTAIAEGTAIITATAEDKSATCTVTVPHVDVPVESVTLSKTSLTLKAGDSETLTATVNPENADDKSVSWKSSDENVATVSAEGVVTAIAPGKAVITAEAGGKSATCNVTVPSPGTPVDIEDLAEDQYEFEV